MYVYLYIYIYIYIDKVIPSSPEFRDVVFEDVVLEDDRCYQQS